MIVNPINTDLVHLLPHKSRNTTTGRFSEPVSTSFANVLRSTFNDALQADAADKASMLELLTGESDDFSGLLIDAQKAELSLNLALQIRNKVVDAYTELMRMQA